MQAHDGESILDHSVYCAKEDPHPPFPPPPQTMVFWKYNPDYSAANTDDEKKKRSKTFYFPNNQSDRPSPSSILSPAPLSIQIQGRARNG